MSLSKVKSVQATGSFPNDYGAIQDNPDLPKHGEKLLYKFEYEMEDGTILTANHKTNTSPFAIGAEVEYEVRKNDPQHGKSGKVSKPDSVNFKSNGSSTPKGGVTEDLRQLMIVRQSSLNRAVEILIHNACVRERADDGITKVDEIEAIELASRLTKWVMGVEKKKEEEKPQPEKVAEAVQGSTIGEEPSDDLPF